MKQRRVIEREQEPTDRVEGESAAAHLAYLDYLFTPALERSIRALQKRYAAAAGRGAKPPSKNLNTLFDWSVKFRWQERVALYDSRERKRRIQAEADAREEMNRRHIQIAQALQAKALVWLSNQEALLHKPHDVLAALKLSTDIERHARGVPDYIVALMNLSNEDLIARYASLTSGAGRPPDLLEQSLDEDVIEAEVIRPGATDADDRAERRGATGDRGD